MQSSFNRCLLGYRPEQVEQVLLETRKEYEQLLSEKQQRMLQLRDENAELSQSRHAYEEKINLVINLLLSAQEQADKILKDAYAKSEAILRHAQLTNARLEREISQRQGLLEELSDTVGRLSIQFRDQIDEQQQQITQQEELLLTQVG